MIVFDLTRYPEPKQYRLTGVQRDTFLAVLLANEAVVQNVDWWSWLISSADSYTYLVRAEKDAPLSEWQQGYDEELSESGDIDEQRAMQEMLTSGWGHRPFRWIATAILVSGNTL